MTTPINLQYIRQRQTSYEIQFDIILYEDVEEAERDEIWSFVRCKANQRWLWLLIDHATHQILAYTFGKRKDEVFRKFQALLDPFSITMLYTDDWGSYDRNIPLESHTVGKKYTQSIERKNLTLCTRIKRLCRNTICYSKTILMHDTVIGLVINILEFGFIYSANNKCLARPNHAHRNAYDAWFVLETKNYSYKSFSYPLYLNDGKDYSENFDLEEID